MGGGRYARVGATIRSSGSASLDRWARSSTETAVTRPGIASRASRVLSPAGMRTPAMSAMRALAMPAPAMPAPGVGCSAGAAVANALLGDPFSKRGRPSVSSSAGDCCELVRARAVQRGSNLAAECATRARSPSMKQGRIHGSTTTVASIDARQIATRASIEPRRAWPSLVASTIDGCRAAWRARGRRA